MDSRGDRSRVGIVGAGVAGVGAANALCEHDVDVMILEKSRGVGGRTATRRKAGCRYDHGANYLKDSDGRTDALVEDLGREGLVDIEEPVWTFDADESIGPGDDRDAHKWTWERGITQFAKRVLDRTDATLETETRIESLDRTADGWRLRDTDSNRHGPFDIVVLTPPAPQTAALLRATTIGDADAAAAEALERAAAAAEAVPYRTIRTLVLHYPFELDLPYYALVNADREHEIGWLSREECKPGHVPDGESLLIVQMAPGWSTDHYDDALGDATIAVARAVAALLGDTRLTNPDWADDRGWRYAIPDDGVDSDALSALREDGLFAAGDWFVGEGRAHKAFWNGVDAGEEIAAALRR
ncbi:NAD(P)/FAD-dependent oxidoreductase [Haloferacaceae archaeon DSL9]